MTATRIIKAGSLELLDSGLIRATVIFPEIAEEDGNEDMDTIGHVDSIDTDDFAAELEVEINRLITQWYNLRGYDFQDLIRDEWYSELRRDYYDSVL